MTLSDRFEMQEEAFISEINCNAQLFRHRKTGAQVLSLSGDDENKVFGASFRTPPPDSTGIAHIMEHSVLCGSRKYPVKAPFLEMLKSSLNTFLNAITFSDKTVYPVASTNLQDFYNLVDVYLDAVLHPRITPETLKQEGWHYELDAPDAPLTYKGVVFNEMKGGYSSPDDRVMRFSWRTLFPDTIYGHEAGGDPAQIPNLTYEAFKHFHESYYHPSNARFFFYGDDDPEKRLEILGAALDEFSAIAPNSAIELQPRFDAPRTIEYSVPVNADAASDKQTRVMLNWLMNEAGDPDESLALHLLGSILLGNSAAPLHKALIDSGLGERVIGGGYSSTAQQAVFSTGLKGVAAADVGTVETLILDTLKRLAEDGIDPLTIEAAINTSEFRLRENNTGAFPRGISILFRALLQWNYDHSPIAPLAWEERLNALKTRLSRGERVFEQLIQRYLLDNPHRTTAIFKPDPDLSEKEASEERARLDKIRAAMSLEEVQSVIEDARRLKTLQETPDSPEALAKLPRLTLADLPGNHTIIPMASGTLSGVRLLFHDLPTSGIIYTDIGFDLRQLPADLLPFVSIFRRALLETGADDLDMVALAQKIGQTTGGISVQNWTSAIVGESGNGPAAWLFIRSKVMPERLADLNELLRKILFSARLDNGERLAQIIDEERARMEASLIPGGHLYIGQRLAAGFHDADWASEQMGGYSYLLALRDMTGLMASDRSQIISKLEQIRERLFRQEAAIINITSDSKGIDAAKDALQGLAGAIPTGEASYLTWNRPDYPVAQGFTLPAKVNYVAKGADLTRLGRSVNGAAVVASHWLRGGWLWDKIRVQGGAYTANCVADPKSGIVYFTSYRDPNLIDTLKVYDDTAGFLRSIADNDLERERAIIGTIGKFDRYELPDAKSMRSLQHYLNGVSDRWLQAMRNEILNVTASDIRNFADALDDLAKNGRIVVMGAEDKLTKANEDLSEPLVLTRLL